MVGIYDIPEAVGVAGSGLVLSLPLEPWRGIGRRLDSMSGMGLYVASSSAFSAGLCIIGAVPNTSANYKQISCHAV